MNKLLTFLFIPLFACAQYIGYTGYSGYSGDDTNAVDSTITLYITSSTDNGTDSVDVIGSNDNTALTDSTYWLINREDVAVTWANADEVQKYNGWQSTATLAHGQTENNSVRIGLACLDTLGDTTAIAQRTHTVSAYDETPPTVPAIVATGVQYDSVRIQLTVTGESGAYMQVRWGSSVSDTTDGALLIDWYTHGNLDTTLLFDVGQDSTVNFYVFAKDSLDNVSGPNTDDATIENAPDATPPGAGTLAASMQPDFKIALGWDYSETGATVKIYSFENDNPDSVLLGTYTSATDDTVPQPLTLKYAGNDTLEIKKYTIDAASNQSTAATVTIAPDYFTMWTDTSDTSISAIDYVIVYRNTSDSTISGSDSMYVYAEDFDLSHSSGDSLGLTMPDTNQIDTSYYATRLVIDETRQDTVSAWQKWPEASGGGCSGSGIVGEDNDTSPNTGYTREGCAAYTASANVCVGYGHIKCNSNFLSSEHVRVCVWSDNSGAPGTLLATSSEITGDGTVHWASASFPSTFQVTSGTTYWVGWIADSDFDYFFDTNDSTPATRYYNDGYSGYPNADDPYSGTQSSSDRSYRVYISDH